MGNHWAHWISTNWRALPALLALLTRRGRRHLLGSLTPIEVRMVGELTTSRWLTHGDRERAAAEALTAVICGRYVGTEAAA